MNPYLVKSAAPMTGLQKAELTGDLSLGLIPGVSPFYYGAKSLGKLFSGNWKGALGDALWTGVSIIPGGGALKGLGSGAKAGFGALRAGKGLAEAGKVLGTAAKGIKGAEYAATAARAGLTGAALAAGGGAHNAGVGVVGDLQPSIGMLQRMRDQFSRYRHGNYARPMRPSDYLMRQGGTIVQV